MNILFLDIDGPMIPDGCYFINPNASAHRTFSPIAVAVLKHFVEKTGVIIVTNTMHNDWLTDDPLTGGFNSIRDDLVNAGIPKESFHEAYKTAYGMPMYADVSRHQAIKMWLEANAPEAKWVCFDDCEFLPKGHVDRDRLILIDFNNGITPRDVVRAAQRLNVEYMPPFGVGF